MRKQKSVLFKPLYIAIGVLISLFSNIASAEIINIGNEALKELLAKDVVIVDVRRAEEWQETGIVEGSHTLTFFDGKGGYDAKKWLTALSTVSTQDQPIILICHSGVRSKVIANWLSNGAGFHTVYNVRQGIAEWIGHGQPTVTINN